MLTSAPHQRCLRGPVRRRVATVARWLGMLALLAGIGVASPVEAGCRKVCTDLRKCDHLDGAERWRCTSGLGYGNQPLSCETVCRDSHGAIAYSRATGSYGYAYDHDSEAHARRAALRYCGRHASDCRVVVTLVDQCGAIAETPRRDVAAGLGKTRKEAEDRSLAACRAAAGTTCSVVAWTCSVE
jgi:hypothetical protein